MTCSFVPPYLLEQIARSDAARGAAARATATLTVDAQLRDLRATTTPRRRAHRRRRPRPAPRRPSPTGPSTRPATPRRCPARPCAASGDPASGDVAVDEAADGIDGALRLFAEVFDRSSYDGAGAAVSVTVHYGRDYDNAFWDGTQLVFGDGDGEIFDRFTKPVDVLGHELSHAVTEHTAGLRYQDQSGALNESVSDVFGSCLKQWLLGQTVDQADWLVGAGLFLPGVSARGLRDMANPGTAYDDPRLGKDPQGASMDDYIETTDDNGGVHLNSGIPNRAFHLAATAIGGRSWEGAGAIWYAALTGGAGRPRHRLRRASRPRPSPPPVTGRTGRRRAPGLGDRRRHARRRLDHPTPTTASPAPTRPSSSCGVPAASPAAPPRVRSTSPRTTRACPRSAPSSTAST